jgi:choline dehydrogenase-like flavoprotein
MEMRKHEVVVVGSGAGGATVARDLSRSGRKVLVVEAGPDKFPLPLSIATSKEGIDMYQAFGAGGATVLCNGNGVRALEQDLAGLGIDLEREYSELEAELHIAPIAESLLSENGSLKLLDILHTSGINMKRMPKFIDPTKCVGCGMCSLGCPNGAKWSAREFLSDALAHGAEIVYNTRVEKVLIENDRAVGIEVTGPSGKERFDANMVILSAGGLKTPVILRSSGFDRAGRRLFVDLCELWLGVTPDIDISDEPPMQLVYTDMAQSHRISLSTGYVKDRDKLQYYCGDKTDLFLNANWMGIIVKIGDETVGRVFADGTVSKGVTQEDRKKFEQGGVMAREILRRAGATDESIIKLDKIYAGHNGATAAIGDLVNTDLQTEVNNLYVCDACVLPLAPGLPPVLTIMALAKRLARRLVR